MAGYIYSNFPQIFYEGVYDLFAEFCIGLGAMIYLI